MATAKLPISTLILGSNLKSLLPLDFVSKLNYQHSRCTETILM